MILTDLKNLRRYECLNKHFTALISYLESNELLAASLGRITVDGDNVFINNICISGVPPESQVLEMHKKYIDVHILLEGSETIGIKSLTQIDSFSKEYDEEGDCMISEEQASYYINMIPGSIMICFPEDAHAPAIGNGVIRKAIAKVVVE